MAKKRIKIKELVDKTGVTRPTIYHYVREGLLPKPKKTARNMALYDPDCVERVLLIKGLQTQHRRSLAEVKAMLEGARGHDGVRHLQEVVEAEATRAQTSPLRADRPTKPIGREALRVRTGFGERELADMERIGLLTAKDGLFEPIEVDVADAVARLAAEGFDREAGFHPDHVTIYMDSMRELLQKEVALFLEKVQASDDPSGLLRRAERGIEHVTPLLLALRRKLLRELLDAVALPGSGGAE
jgi:DNA-binding transcriptional MerR regulator